MSEFMKRLAKDVLDERDRLPICRCGRPFKKWRHSRVDGAPICEPCFAAEDAAMDGYQVNIVSHAKLHMIIDAASKPTDSESS